MGMKLSLVFGEEHRLRVYETRVLRRIFGPKSDEIIGSWREDNNKEPYDLYSLPSINVTIQSSSIQLAGHVERMGQKMSAVRYLVGKPETKRPLGKLRCRWEESVKWILEKENGGCGQDTDQWKALVNTLKNHRVL
jgi:hypothetical protein